MNKYIDTHAHYGHTKFKQSEQSLLAEMKNYCHNIIQVGTNTKSNLQTEHFVNTYDYIYGVVGYFPTDVWELEPVFCKDAEDNWQKLMQQLTTPKVVGLGEIGLDYNWNKVGNSCFGEDAQKLQQKWFRAQLNLAKETKLPVSIHSRDAESDTLAIFDQYELIPGVIHCFSYGISAAKKAIDKGLYLGIGGTSTYPSNKELIDVIKMAPLDRILLETDAPYLSPNPVRKEVNTSKNIEYIIQNIAQIKNVDVDTIIETTNVNAHRLFERLK